MEETDSLELPEKQELSLEQTRKYMEDVYAKLPTELPCR